MRDDTTETTDLSGPGRSGGATRQRRAAAMAPEDRRASIVAAAKPLLLEHGPNVTTKQIAEAAGVAEGTLYRVFPDKDALLDAVLESATDTAPVEAAIAAIDPTLPFDEQLTKAVEILQQRTRVIWQLVTAAGIALRPPGRRIATLPALAALFAAHPEATTVAPRFAADALRALTLAMTHPRLAPGRPQRPEAIVAMFLDGVRARPGGR